MINLKVVLDTNVLVSALLRRNSIPHRIFEAAENQVFLLCISPGIIKEVEAVISRPTLVKRTQMNERERTVFLNTLKEVSVLIEPSKELPPLAADPDDTKFLECALEGQVDYIVSGDNHLLQLGIYEGIKILSPRDFVESVLE